MQPIILLVDDNEEILEFLERMLRNKYTILKAEDGAEALKILEREAIQLVISDVMMPVMDGFELCKRIKSNFEFSHIPVILLTAKNSIQAKVEGLELGADAYIEKPFSKEYLQAQMASLLNNRNIIREYFANSPLIHIKSMAHSKADELFLESLHDTITKNIEDTDLDVEKLAEIMNMSRITLYRKIKAISVLTPIELINITRLKKAAELLAQGNHRIFEVSYMVGFSSQSNFARNFQKHFNITPTEYMHSKQLEKEKK
ncbi:DNA-binding response OmpR family regulator [Arcicella sp. BE140]|uniref:Response regulator n=2 Tax=Arcicella TaxID=217140 RepID=A0ABU5QRH9_9BACT|nr:MULTISPECIES: response regulator [Arcicella]MDR6562341.1 DNA-binding response OmpR family regulator [Arcicella sp. BE51]MDR6812235.1 DNA-binding response OmpR family regulator [Arcicella sp. BE140]MDR6823566.1 DNA-binding response OmpR family regulator [Arcicella sp. BE139]MEA5259702.1 response regulator [Arcicella aquatica]